MIATNATAEIGTTMYLETPMYSAAKLMPMNSVTIVKKFEQEQVADGKPAPATAEAFVDQPGVPDPGDRAEPDHHLLVDDEHRDQQQQHPQQGVAVVLAGLGVGGHPAGVVVADHHDDPGTDDGQQGQQPRLQRAGSLGVADADTPECALDVA